MAEIKGGGWRVGPWRRGQPGRGSQMGGPLGQQRDCSFVRREPCTALGRGGRIGLSFSRTPQHPGGPVPSRGLSGSPSLPSAHTPTPREGAKAPAALGLGKERRKCCKNASCGCLEAKLGSGASSGRSHRGSWAGTHSLKPAPVSQKLLRTRPRATQGTPAPGHQRGHDVPGLPLSPSDWAHRTRAAWATFSLTL